MAADTLRPARLGAAVALSPILDEADRDGQASRIVVMDGGLYRLAFVPVARRHRARGSARASRSTIDALPTCGGAPGFKSRFFGASIPDSSFMRPRSRVSSGTISSERSPHRGQPSSFVLTGAFWLRPK